MNPEKLVSDTILVLVNNRKQQLNARFFPKIKLLKEDCQKALKRLNLQDFCHKFSFFNRFTQTWPFNCQNSLNVMKGLILEEIQALRLCTWNFQEY